MEAGARSLTRPTEEALSRGLGRWVDGVRRRAVQVSIATLLVTLLMALYTASHLGINSDNVSVVSESLPSRQAYQEFSSLFPNLDNALLVVIDADTPELARQAADRLSASLALQKDRFTDVYQPLAGEFFERNGLLYLELDDLDHLADQMTQLQPVLAELEREASLRQLAEIIEFALEEVHRKGDGEEQWAMVLDGIRQAAGSTRSTSRSCETARAATCSRPPRPAPSSTAR